MNWYSLHKGRGKVLTMFGELDFKVRRLYFDTTRNRLSNSIWWKENRLLFVESFWSHFYTRRYRNDFGQLLGAPHFVKETSFVRRICALLMRQEFDILSKSKYVSLCVCESSFFDVVGWDGHFTHILFSLLISEPITGRIHMPPSIRILKPEHLWFAHSCLVFVRLSPFEIPAPYHHSNIDSDEILYYVDGDFMSRNNIQKGQVHIAPGGIPHGPHPGRSKEVLAKRKQKNWQNDRSSCRWWSQDAIDIEGAGLLQIMVIKSIAKIKTFSNMEVLVGKNRISMK